MTTIINYNAIVQELEKALKFSNEKSIPSLTHSKNVILREYYTVGMHLPRQLGTSLFILKEMIMNPTAYCVCISQVLIDIQLSLLKEMITASSSGGKVNIRGFHSFDIDPEIKNILINTPTIFDILKENFITAKTLHGYIDKKVKIKTPISKIYLDGGTYIFTTVRYKKFYDWLGEQSEDYISTWVIN